MERKSVSIILTDEQAKEFKQFFKKFEKSFYAGKPGAIIAQVQWDYTSLKATVTASYIDHETVKKVREATGVNEK